MDIPYTDVNNPDDADYWPLAPLGVAQPPNPGPDNYMISLVRRIDYRKGGIIYYLSTTCVIETIKALLPLIHFRK